MKTVGTCVCLLIWASASSAAPNAALEAAVRDRLAVRSLDIVELDLPDQTGDGFAATVNLDGVERRLLLQPHSLRSPDFQLLERDGDGKLISGESIPPPCTVRGTVEGRPGSEVAGSLADGQLDALVRLDADSSDLWCIQPAKALVPDAPAALHIVYQSTELAPSQARCGSDHIPPIETGDQGSRPSTSPGALAAGGPQVADLLIETDFPFWQLHGSSRTRAFREVELVLNLVDVIYRRDIDISYAIRYLIPWTSPDNYGGTVAEEVLELLRDAWDSGLPGGVERDTVHLFSGRNLDDGVVGIAYQPGFCTPSPGYGYGLSAASTMSVIERAAVTAHELGHNWSAGHCDGNPGCDIMCSFIGGCEGNITSFTLSAPIIDFYRNSFSCTGLFALPWFTVWVDWRNQSGNQDGTPQHPFSWPLPGYWRVEPGGTLSIANGVYESSHLMQKAATLVATGGPVLITGFASRPPGASESVGASASDVSYMGRK